MKETSKKNQRAILTILLLSYIASSAMATSNIELVESNASIESNTLTVEMLFKNTGEQSGKVKIQANYFNQIDTQIETIPKKSTKLFTYKISNVKPGEIRFAVLADKNAFIKIIVPENQSQGNILLVHEITEGEWKTGLPESSPISSLFNAFKHLIQSPDAIAIATVLLIVVAALLAIKIAFRKKTLEEQQAEMTEKLLKEVEEIEEKRKKSKKNSHPDGLSLTRSLSEITQKENNRYFHKSKANGRVHAK